MTKDKFIDWLHGYLEFAQTGEIGLTHKQLEAVIARLTRLEDLPAAPVSPVVQVLSHGAAFREHDPNEDEEEDETPEVPENLRHRPPPIPAGRLIRG